jgi:excisionase family DNA binding protein
MLMVSVGYANTRPAGLNIRGIQDSMAELMTVGELASYLRVTEKTVYRLLKRGLLPATKVGRQWRFDKALVDGWLHQRPSEAKASILVVDDEQSIRLMFKQTLEELGHRVEVAESSLKGLELVKQRNFDMVFLDLKMPMMDGAELFRQIKALRPKLPVIIITGYPDSEIMARALSLGPFGVMNKPFSASDIITAVNTFVQFTAPKV